MRAQNQLSFSDWQNLILFTQKKNPPENFSNGGFRRPAAVSGERCSFRRATTVVNGGGSNGQWCKVVVVVNGERIRKIESCSNEGCKKKNNCSNEGCQGK